MTDAEKTAFSDLIRMVGDAERFNYIEYAINSGEKYNDIRRAVLFGISFGILKNESNGSFEVDRARLNGENASERRTTLFDISDKLVPRMFNIVDRVIEEPGVSKEFIYADSAFVSFLAKRMISTLTEMRIIRCEGEKLYPEIGRECFELLKRLSELKPQ